jgi:hypothetical protein
MIQEDSTTTLQDQTDTLQNQPDSSTLIAQGGGGVGSWQLLSYSSPILPCHAALLRTGKVFFFAGSGNDPDQCRRNQGQCSLRSE